MPRHLPVGDVPARGHLQPAKDGVVQPPAADQRKRVRMVHDGSARDERGVLLGGIDDVRVFLPGRGHRTEADDAVLRVEENGLAFRYMVGNQDGQADSQVDDGMFGQIHRYPGGDLIIRPTLTHLAPPLSGRRIRRAYGRRRDRYCRREPSAWPRRWSCAPPWP
ncbi:Uncharacterised protein [Bordetella pertussis]|nr:Uncharacterised protein [Bordetella pertussis]